MKRGIQFVVIFVLFTGLMACAQLKQVREMPINEIDLSQIGDGTYTGDFTYGFLGRDFTYAVETTVQANRITDIRVTNNRNTNHAKRAENIIPRVIEAQSPNVDAHTGATTTSKALLKAIERSLVKGIPDEYEMPPTKATDAETGATSNHHE
ncbi:MAG: FMN-binding protein [Candidatus Magnetomorum sp.]|nr:FMN-binding protein [Candidatus Magnetomorum sp.]